MRSIFALCVVAMHQRCSPHRRETTGNEAVVGTEITLSLNGIDIDWGKNRYWRSHDWLFPPGSTADIEYTYADDVVEVKPGFQASLGEVHFRLCHLGYSLQESKEKFDAAVVRWNRTADLRLSFEDFRTALAGVDFSSLTPADLVPHCWDFRSFVVSLLAESDEDEVMLEDFIAGLDFALTLRALADRVENRSLCLRWHYHDLVESGWASFEDLIDIDREASIVNHTVLFGRLQERSGERDLKGFGGWLERQGLLRAATYRRVKRDGVVVGETMTLPVAVRNMIHHPENSHNVLSDEALRQSIELLLQVARHIPSLLPDFADSEASHAAG